MLYEDGVPSPHGHHSLLDLEDEEPDELWKEARKQSIAESFSDMIQEAKDRLETQLQNIRGLENEEYQKRSLIDMFQNEVSAIKALAKGELDHAVARERLQRRLRKDLPYASPSSSPSQAVNPGLNLRLELEHEQAAALAERGGSNLEAAFHSLMDLSSLSHHRASSPLADLEEEPEAEEEDEYDYVPAVEEEDLLRLDDEDEEVQLPEEPTTPIIDAYGGALAIRITRLHPEPPAVHSWVNASDMARKHEQEKRQRKADQAQLQIEAAEPVPPPVKWVSASEVAARKTPYTRMISQG